MRAILLVLCLELAGMAQSGSSPKVEEIVSRLTSMDQARAIALHSYRSTRTYEVSYKGFPKSLSAKAVVRLDFTPPDKKQFTIVSEQGSSLLINHVIRKALASEQEAATPAFKERAELSKRNYRFEYLGNNTVDGRPCYALQVTPKRPDKYLYEGRICVDAEDYAVLRIDAKPAKNSSFWINHVRIESGSIKIGDLWFPAWTDSTSQVRFGGNAELKIDYGDYQIFENQARGVPTISALPSRNSPKSSIAGLHSHSHQFSR